MREDLSTKELFIGMSVLSAYMVAVNSIYSLGGEKVEATLAKTQRTEYSYVENKGRGIPVSSAPVVDLYCDERKNYCIISDTTGKNNGRSPNWKVPRNYFSKTRRFNNRKMVPHRDRVEVAIVN